jgi:multiple sugar transport system permease protein
MLNRYATARELAQPKEVVKKPTFKLPPLPQFFVYVLLAFGALIMVLPFIDMFVGALRTPAERLARPPVYWPRTPNWDIYREAFRAFPLGLWFLNSLLVTGLITLFQLTTSTMAGFALAKYQFPGRELIFRIVLAAQMFPFFLFLIPTFFVMKFFPLAGGNNLLGIGGNGFLGSYPALILPFLVSWYGIFLMRQFMMTIPDDILDAARIDGCSEFRLLWNIVLPLVTPALATLSLFVFIYHWNEFIWTMTIARTSPDLTTLPVGIYLSRSVFASPGQESLLQAALAISVVPVAILFLALQRFYVKGLTSGAVKG